MTTFQAIVYGIVQGLTEFLPISSTAHLRIVPAMIGWPDPGAAFTAVVQLGTAAAVVVHFARDLWSIASSWGRSLRRPELRQTFEARLGWYIGLGTLPIVVLGLAFRDQIETGGRNLVLIAIALIAGGIVLAASERVGRRIRPLGVLNATDATVIGFAQAAALVPGVSRSGATISAGLFRQFDRSAAARYSFLLSVPAVVLSGLFEARKVGGAGVGFGTALLATAVAFVVGYASISFLLRWVAHHSMDAFAVYRIGLGLITLGLVATSAIS
jgi:undecaprenyl-diphosphatase